MKNYRLQSLDMLRGLTVACMIFVNNGAGNEIFSTLQHSKWNGMTPCDLVFPFFLFIMGISTYLSLVKTQFNWSTGVARKIAKRGLLLFIIGLAINWFDMACEGQPTDLGHLRVWGVMQRIALCYVAVSVFAMSVRHRYVLPTVIGLLAVYGLIVLAGNGYAYNASNLLHRVDEFLSGNKHLYHKSPVDPEGLVSTLPAIAHTLTGFYLGRKMVKANNTVEKVLSFLTAGAVLCIVGYLLSFGLPLNKRIWSPSYVLVTCGLASLCLGLIMYAVDLRQPAAGMRQAITACLIFGTNPLFLYIVSELFGILAGASGVKDGLFDGMNSLVGNGYWASVAYATLFVSLHAALGYPLYKKHIYIKL